MITANIITANISTHIKETVTLRQLYSLMCIHNSHLSNTNSGSVQYNVSRKQITKNECKKIVVSKKKLQLLNQFTVSHNKMPITATEYRNCTAINTPPPQPEPKTATVQMCGSSEHSIVLLSCVWLLYGTNPTVCSRWHKKKVFLLPFVRLYQERGAEGAKR